MTCQRTTGVQHNRTPSTPHSARRRAVSSDILKVKEAWLGLSAASPQPAACWRLTAFDPGHSVDYSESL